MFKSIFSALGLFVALSFVVPPGYKLYTTYLDWVRRNDITIASKQTTQPTEDSFKEQYETTSASICRTSPLAMEATLHFEIDNTKWKEHIPFSMRISNEEASLRLWAIASERAALSRQDCKVHRLSRFEYKITNNNDGPGLITKMRPAE